MPSIPTDYAERVYAGVLGKIIGVYLGRPIEGWTYERIMAELGEIKYYVNEKLGQPLIVTDDDIAGTFTFLRALPDYGNSPDLTPQQIGQTWLNYIVENRTILSWGGLGNSTEHTAFLRLKRGIPAPRSGSIELNGKTVAEQIGAQIFIDGWAMVSPGDPQRAADLARRAASVSHDGEAVYAAQVVAALEAQAFVERDLDRLLDTAVTFIPANSIIYRLIQDLRDWRAGEPDWRKTRRKIVQEYGYQRYGGNCHVVPNHALILLGLLYGEDDFRKTLTITNTAGWDTDCNSGNVGCLMGIKNGLEGIDAGPDWRGPLADRLYLSSADGGRAISDAVTETYAIVNSGRALAGLEAVAPKAGARFHFELPGSMQGFLADEVAPGEASLALANETGHSHAGRRSLALRYHFREAGCAARVRTATFIPPEARAFVGYDLAASPTLYPGQTVRARISADQTNELPVSGRLYVSVYAEADQLRRIYGPEVIFAKGDEKNLTWKIGPTGGTPIAEVGFEICSDRETAGTLYLDFLTWDGEPEVDLVRPDGSGSMWQRAWVNALDLWDPNAPETYRLIQNEGRGLLIEGCREWRNYRLRAELTPHLAEGLGLAVRVQGLRRYYALLLRKGGKIQLVKVLDGEKLLAEADFDWSFEKTYRLSLEANGTRLRAISGDDLVLEAEDTEQPLTGGAVALVVVEGRMAVEDVSVRPVK